MTTLFQLYANMDTLKHHTQQLAQLWHRGDQILLLGDSVMLTDWLSVYISDINMDSENADSARNAIQDIDALFVLQTDRDKLNKTAKTNIDFAQFKLATVSVIDDKQWVAITQSVDRVVTIY